jgi:hypothetical protein
MSVRWTQKRTLWPFPQASRSGLLRPAGAIRLQDVATPLSITWRIPEVHAEVVAFEDQHRDIRDQRDGPGCKSAKPKTVTSSA